MTRNRSRLWALLAWLPVLVIGMAGVAKLLDLPAFGQAVRTWVLIPKSLQSVISVAIPIYEVAVAGLWMIGVRRRAVEWGIVAFLFLVTIAYVWHWYAAPQPPACGCFGAGKVSDGRGGELAWVLIRNTLLISMLMLPRALYLRYRTRQQRLAVSLHPEHGVASVLTSRKPQYRSTDSLEESGVSARRLSRSQDTRGFTVIELCLSIAIIAILTVLGVTHLAGSRTAARNRVNESNLRSHAAVFHAYATDYQDSMPAFQLNDDGSSTARCESGDVEFPLPFFAMTRYWHFPLADQYYAGDYRSKSFITPFNKGGSLQEVNYLLPCVYLAHPDLYTVGKRRSLPDQIAAQRLSHVIYPSQKSLLVAKYPWISDGYVGLADARGRSTGVAAADGHAGTYKQNQMLLGAMHEPTFVDGKLYSDHFAEDFPLIHSLGGIRARDLR